MLSSLTPSPVRVLIVDDHAVVRVGLKTILGDNPRICVVGEAATGEECLRRAVELTPDVVILDLRLGDLPGIEVCRKLKALPHRPGVLVLTSFADDQLVLSTIQAGADGYLLKDLDEIDLAVAILHVAGGGSFLDPVITGILMSASRTDSGGQGAAKRLSHLSPQEERVLRLIAAGRTNKEVGTEMNLADGTVRNYLSSVFTKLGVQNRTEAAAIWLQHTKSNASSFSCPPL
jgi:DNA-binding NarL/FixJ family response regulator